MIRILASFIHSLKTYLELTVGEPYKSISYSAHHRPKKAKRERKPSYISVLDAIRKQREMTSPEIVSDGEINHVESVTNHYLRENQAGDPPAWH